jgi:hypothetical protein
VTVAGAIEDFDAFWSIATDLLSGVEFNKQRKIHLMELFISNPMDTDEA